MPNFDIVSSFQDQAWLADKKEKLDRMMRYSVEKARQTPWFHYTTDGKIWKENRIGWWTNGFWPANMWQM